MTTQECASVDRFVATIFEQLERQKLPYIVLRNYDGLPGHVGNDIDILVAESELNRFSIVLYKTATREGWYLAQHAKRYGFRSFIFVPMPAIVTNQSLKWDVWAPISWKGFTWVDTEVALGNRQAHQNGFYIPAPGVEAATLLLKEVLQFGKIKSKYLGRIQQFAQADSEGFKKVLEKPFGEKLANHLVVQAQRGDWSNIENFYRFLRLTLVKNAIKHSIAFSLVSTLRFVMGHLRQYVRGQRSLLLCVIGPDGSGKSTISSLLIESMSDIFENACYYHGRYGLLPELKKFCPWWQQKVGEATKSDLSIESKLQSRVIISLLMFYYAIDNMFFYARVLRRRSIAELIIFDRYFYDYIIAPSPFEIDSWLFRVLARLIPTPDIVIYLHASPEVIHNRKPELTVQEIKRRSAVCIRLVTFLPNAYRVDNLQPLNEVIIQIREIILEKMIAHTTSNWRQGRAKK